MDYNYRDDFFRLKYKAELDFASFEAFLESFISKEELDYIEDVNLARGLVEHGICTKEKEGFEREEYIKCRNIQRSNLYSTVSTVGYGLDVDHDPMLKALQMRELDNRTGKMASIIMVRDYNKKDKEVSGYIDYADRLRTEDMKLVFHGEKKFLPKKGDLSYMTWTNMKTYTKNSPNYEVLTDSMDGMRFRNKKDDKILNPNIYSKTCGEKSIRTAIRTKDYLQVVFFDHMNMKRA